MLASTTICVLIFFSGALSASLNEVDNSGENRGFNHNPALNIADLLRARYRRRTSRKTTVVVIDAIHCPINKEYDEEKGKCVKSSRRATSAIDCRIDQEYDERRQRCVSKNSWKVKSAIDCRIDQEYDERKQRCVPKNSWKVKSAIDCRIDQEYDERKQRCVSKNSWSGSVKCSQRYNGRCSDYGYGYISSDRIREKYGCPVAVCDRTCSRYEFVIHYGCPVCICLNSNYGSNQVSYSTVEPCSSSADCRSRLTLQRCLNNVCRYNALKYSTSRFCGNSHYECKHDEECRSNTCQQRQRTFYEHVVHHHVVTNVRTACIYQNLCPFSYTCRRDRTCWKTSDSLCYSNDDCDMFERCVNKSCEICDASNWNCKIEHSSSPGFGFFTHFQFNGRRK